jgi:hypothetical protein
MRGSRLGSFSLEDAESCELSETVSEEGTHKHEEVRGGLDTTHKQHKTTHYKPHKRLKDHSPKELPPLLDLRRFEGGQVESALRTDCSSLATVFRVF